MSATPIPRTLMMTAYGDLDVSRLTGEATGPAAGRYPRRAARPLRGISAGIARALKRGAKVFWICPIVEEAEDGDTAAAEERYRALAELLPGRVGLVHGRMKSAEKDRAMAAFAASDPKGTGVDLLVATTVIESASTSPPQRSWSSNTRSASGSRNCINCAAASAAATNLSTCILLYQAPLGEVARSASRSSAKPRTVSASPKRICDCAAPARYSGPGRAGSRRCVLLTSRNTRS